MSDKQSDAQGQGAKEEFAWYLLADKVLRRCIFLGFVYWCYRTTLDSLVYLVQHSSPEQIRALGDAIATVLPFNPLPWFISAVFFANWLINRVGKKRQNKHFGEYREKNEKNDTPQRTSSGLTKEGQTPKGVNL